MEPALSERPQESVTRISVPTLVRNGGAEFALRPGRAERRAIAETLGIEDLPKLTFSGAIRAEGRADWRLEARLGATVVQSCVVTLAPVRSRIDETVLRRFIADPRPVPEAAEAEIPEDDSEEPLGDEIDLLAVAEEALALALPPYPRAPGAELGDARFTAPGTDPMSDDETRPFAALKHLRDRDGESDA